MNDLQLALLIVGLALVVVFFVLREFWTWYWKQSEQVALLKSIDAHLARLDGQPTPPAAPTTDASGYATAPWTRT